MTTRTPAELHFIRTGNPLPTVEIDIDSLPANAFGYADIVHAALAPLAASNPQLRATIYVHQGPSINFGEPKYCAFFGVAGDLTALEALYACFRDTKGLKVRYSDQIVESQALRQYHLEDGKLWYPDDGYLWCTDGDADDEVECDNEGVVDGGNWDDDAAGPEKGDEEVATSADAHQGRMELPTRFRAARSDASVGTISRKIETVFGLPEGSVALRGPDRKVLRSDATVRTLRRRWE